MIADAQSATGVVLPITARVSSSRWTVAVLLALSEIVYISLVRFSAVSTAHSVITFLALIALLFLFYGAAHLVLRKLHGPRRSALVLIITGAVLFRLTLLFAGLPHHEWQQTARAVRADVRGEAVTYESYLLFDNDIWRYLWDGHVSARGVNPYAFEPRSPALDTLADSADGSTRWGDIRANVNHPDIPTIYPPFAQVVFRAAYVLAPGSVFAMKLLLMGCDLLTVLLVGLTLRALNRPVTDVVLYAWNPLVIKAVAGSGHVDAVLATLLAATVYFVVRGSRSLAAIAWALSVLVKMSPLVLLPFLLRRLGWRRTALGVAVVVIGYAPYLDSRGTAFTGLRTFAREWQFNSGFFSLVEWLAGFFTSNPIVVAKIAAALIFLTLMLWLIRNDDAEGTTFALWSITALGGLVLLSPTVMPWYLIWLIPLAVVARSSAWIRLSPLVCVAFLVMIDGKERAWALALEYGILAVLLWREYLLPGCGWNLSQSSGCRGKAEGAKQIRGCFRQGGKACSASH